MLRFETIRNISFHANDVSCSIACRILFLRIGSITAIHFYPEEAVVIFGTANAVDRSGTFHSSDLIKLVRLGPALCPHSKALFP